MIDQNELLVWYGQRMVGFLWRNDAGYLCFRYDAQWISDGGFAVSRTLPLDVADYDDMGGVAHRYFANLLPEGGARAHVVRDLKVPDTDFDLLRAIGGECAGALSVLPVEHEPSRSYQYKLLSDVDLVQLITQRGHIYANVTPEQRPRLSLAGAQEKCALLYKKGHYYNPVGDAPSTHIIKFESSDYRHLPLYEVFTGMLAKRIGLPVVASELCETNNKSFARIERYDRQRVDEDAIVRLHQEDFCQALGYSHLRKYQHDGGPSFADCLNLVRIASSDPVVDSKNLLQWQIFNVLAGNSDGHAKNLSLLYLRNGQIRLTPFYDLICTRAIDRIDANLAFSVGGQRNPASISADHWTDFAVQCDVGKTYLLGLVKKTAEQLLDCLPEVKDEFENEYGQRPALQRIEKIVRQQSKKAVRSG